MSGNKGSVGGALLLTVFVTMIVGGTAMINYAHGGDILSIIGGCLIGWPILFILFINLFWD